MVCGWDENVCLALFLRSGKKDQSLFSFFFFLLLSYFLLLFCKEKKEVQNSYRHMGSLGSYSIDHVHSIHSTYHLPLSFVFMGKASKLYYFRILFSICMLEKFLSYQK